MSSKSTPKKKNSPKKDTPLKLYMITSKNDMEKDVYIANKVYETYGKKENYQTEYVTLDMEFDYISNVFNVKSLVSDNKVVYINYDIKELSKKYIIKKPKKKTVTYEELFVDMFKGLDKDILIFLLPNNSDKRKSLQKYVTENHNFVEIPEATDEYIEKYIKSYAKENKCKIDSASIKYIINNVNKDGYLIKSELDKLFSLTDDITLDIAKDLIVVSAEVVVFDIIDAIAKKDRKKTINLISSYMTSNDNIFALIVLLQRNFRMLYYAIVFKNSFADKMKMNKFIANKYSDRVKLFTEREIVNDLKLLLDVECELKSGLNPNNVVYELALSLTKK